MQIITKNIRWRALMETYQTATSLIALRTTSLEISCLRTGGQTEKNEKNKGEKKRIRKAKTIDLHLHADLIGVTQ